MPCETQVDEAILVVGDVLIDTDAHQVRIADAAVDMPRRELALLTLLARNAGTVLPYGAIVDHIWGTGGATMHSLRVLVGVLRRRLSSGPERPVVVTVVGTGYRLLVPDRGS